MNPLHSLKFMIFIGFGWVCSLVLVELIRVRSSVILDFGLFLTKLVLSSGLFLGFRMGLKFEAVQSPLYFGFIYVFYENFVIGTRTPSLKASSLNIYMFE